MVSKTLAISEVVTMPQRSGCIHFWPVEQPWVLIDNRKEEKLILKFFFPQSAILLPNKRNFFFLLINSTPFTMLILPPYFFWSSFSLKVSWFGLFAYLLQYVSEECKRHTWHWYHVIKLIWKYKRAN